MRINPGNFEFQRMGKHRKVVAKKADSSLVYAAHKCSGGVQKSAHDSPDQKHAKQNTKNFLISFTGHFDYPVWMTPCIKFAQRFVSKVCPEVTIKMKPQDRQILFQEMKVPIIARFSASFEIYGNPILLSKLASTISFWFSNWHKIRFVFIQSNRVVSRRCCIKGPFTIPGTLWAGIKSFSWIETMANVSVFIS